MKPKGDDAETEHWIDVELRKLFPQSETGGQVERLAAELEKADEVDRVMAGMRQTITALEARGLSLGEVTRLLSSFVGRYYSRGLQSTRAEVLHAANGRGVARDVLVDAIAMAAGKRPPRGKPRTLAKAALRTQLSRAATQAQETQRRIAMKEPEDVARSERRRARMARSQRKAVTDDK